MLVRCAAQTDIQDILDLWQAAGSSPGPTDHADVLASVSRRPDAALLVAIDDEHQIVGSIIATFDGWRGHLYRLAVHPSVQRRGLARRLVEEAEAFLRDRGARRVLAIVEHDRPWAVAFWNAVGYPADPRIRRHARNLATPDTAATRAMG